MLKIPLSTVILSFQWVLVHFLYHLFVYTVDLTRWTLKYYANQVLLACFPAYSSQGKLKRLADTASELWTRGRKVPRHVAIVLPRKEPPGPIDTLCANIKRVCNGNNIEDTQGTHVTKEDSGLLSLGQTDLRTVAKVLSWTWAADIHLVSLFDHDGFLKASSKKLVQYLNEEISQSHYIIKGEGERLPIVRLHNVPPITVRNGFYAHKPCVQDHHAHNGNLNNGDSAEHYIHICLFSKEDGKEALVEACTQLYLTKDTIKSSYLNSSSSSHPLTESEIDVEINRVLDLPSSSSQKETDLDLKAEPDILLVLGKVTSVLGFLPWHVRLTELHWLPSLRRLEVEDFTQSIIKYANCHQRFGT